MQRKPYYRNILRRTLLATCVVIAFAGAAHAQTVVTSPETDTVKGRVPVVATAIITGTPSGSGGRWLAGDVLTAEYTITDPDGDDPYLPGSDTTIQWTVDGAPVGPAGSKTYTIQASDAGKAITYRVTPATDPALTDPFQGVESIAANIGADGNGTGPGTINPEAADALLSVAITGSPLVASQLNAVPTCVSTCGGGISYQWQLETAEGSGVYADISGATGASYTPQRTDQKRRVKVVATK